MRIKNTKELRLRASSHAKNDHILQGTYGRGDINGSYHYKGCAVGCLCVPHRKRDMEAFLREHLAPRTPYFESGDEKYLDESGDFQRAALAKEFGINETLAIAAEGFFEGQPTHGGAINFVKDFAKALPEGANIKASDVAPAMRRILREAKLTDDYGRDSIQYVTCEDYSDIAGCFEYETPEKIKEITDAFLEWVRTRS